MQKSRTASWNDLPYDLEARILSCLSPTELGCVSSTRKSFLEVYRSYQKDLCDQVAVRFGREWLLGFAEICNRFNKESTADKDLAKSIGQLSLETITNNTILNVTLHPGTSAALRVQVWPHVGIWMILPKRQQEFGWISLLQPLLTWGVPPFQGNQRVYLDINEGAYLATMAWVKSEIAPLLPLVAECKITGWAGNLVGNPIIIKERKPVGEMGSDVNRGITLVVRLLFRE